VRQRVLDLEGETADYSSGDPDWAIPIEGRCAVAVA